MRGRPLTEGAPKQFYEMFKRGADRNCYIYIYIYIYVYVCMYVCMYIYIYI